MTMSPEARDALRLRNAARPYTCRRCGGPNTYLADGATCDGFPGLTYKVCPGCGHAEPKPKTRLPSRKETR